MKAILAEVHLKILKEKLQEIWLLLLKVSMKNDKSDNINVISFFWFLITLIDIIQYDFIKKL